MHLILVQTDSDSVVLCFTDLKVNKETHTAAEPGAIVATTILPFFHGNSSAGFTTVTIEET